MLSLFYHQKIIEAPRADSIYLYLTSYRTGLARVTFNPTSHSALFCGHFRAVTAPGQPRVTWIILRRGTTCDCVLLGHYSQLIFQLKLYFCPPCYEPLNGISRLDSMMVFLSFSSSLLAFSSQMCPNSRKKHGVSRLHVIESQDHSKIFPSKKNPHCKVCRALKCTQCALSDSSPVSTRLAQDCHPRQSP